MSPGAGDPGTVRGPVLALDASSARPCVALAGPGDEPWGCWVQAEGTRGTAELALAAQRLLSERGLDLRALAGLAVGTGPGSYTGLRASIAFVRALAFATGLPLVGVPSVAAAARGLLRTHPGVQAVSVLVDARRGECYRADYARRAGECEQVLAPCLVPAEEAERLVASATSDRIVVREPVPDGYDVVALGRRRLAAGGDDPALVVPLYLKRSHAEIALEERAGGT